MRSIYTPKENNLHKTVQVKFFSIGDRNPFTPHHTLGYSARALAKSKASFDRLNIRADNRYKPLQRYFYIRNKPSYIQNMTRRNGENVSSASFSYAGLSTLLRLVTLFDSGARGYSNYKRLIMMTSLLAGIVRTAVPNPILNRVSLVMGGAK